MFLIPLYFLQKAEYRLHMALGNRIGIMQCPQCLFRKFIQPFFIHGTNLCVVPTPSRMIGGGFQTDMYAFIISTFNCIHNLLSLALGALPCPEPLEQACCKSQLSPHKWQPIPHCHACQGWHHHRRRPGQQRSRHLRGRGIPSRHLWTHTGSRG